MRDFVIHSGSIGGDGAGRPGIPGHRDTQRPGQGTDHGYSVLAVVWLVVVLLLSILLYCDCT